MGRSKAVQLTLAAAAAAAMAVAVAPQAALGGETAKKDTTGGDWKLVKKKAPWEARAGLQAVTLGGKMYVLGGRVPNPPATPPIPGDSRLLNDVWRTDNGGRGWKKVAATSPGKRWAPRAYFAAVTKGRRMFVLGGQDYTVTPNACPPAFIAPDCPPFVSQSQFFNDVWSSKDGKSWKRLTAAAPWEGRAGLSAAVLGKSIYVFGGSSNDDASIIGGPPQRVYFNDVWKSRDGRTWRKVADAPWSKRAGAATAVKDGSLYVLGGEVGFTCEPQPDCTPPYFNDVWRTDNGKKWKRVTKSAGWSPRPGHKCEVLAGRIVCFGGFGQPKNPTDVWSSRNGKSWKKIPGAPWNAKSDTEIKYDFDSAVWSNRKGVERIYTFGGDRETFDFADPQNYLRVDNDVWRFGLTGASSGSSGSGGSGGSKRH